jgi:hypothetical protein
VFRAHDAVRDRPVAVKLFTLDLAPERVHQLVAELNRIIAADLTHPALATPLAAGIHGVSAYLVQEFVAADSVDMVIREYGAAPAVDALRVAAQLAGALDFAAAVHVRHGALHPRDVLLSSDETRLTGVGIAHALEQIGVGAPVRRPYTPPERIAGGEWDRRADVFSLAMVTHELLWARRVSGVGARAVENMTEIPGGDLGALRAVFARALAEDPASRFETALDFADALRRAFPGAILDGHQPAVVDHQPSVVDQQFSEFEDQPPVVSHQSPVVSRQPAVNSPQSPVGSRQPAVTRPQSKPQPASGHRRPTTDDGRLTPESPRLPLLDRTGDVELPISEFSAAEEERHWEVAATPAIAVPDATASTPGSRTYLDYVRDEPERIDLGMRQPPVSPVSPLAAVAPVVVREAPPAMRPPLERSPSSMWPLIAALAVGLTMGFAAGYGLGTRQRPVPASVAPPAEPSAAQAVREFTESPVASPPAAPAAAPPNSEVESPKPDANLKSEVSNLQSPNASGRLLVRSTPAGALVFVDGRQYGVTPVAVRDLSNGGHRVRVVRDGYAAAERRVVLTPSRPSQSLTIALERPGNAPARGAQTPVPSYAPGTSGRFTGALMVVSRPPGAAVFMDGKSVGATPLTLRTVTAGTHAIRLEYEGYRRWTSAIRVVASEQNRVTASLER